LAGASMTQDEQIDPVAIYHKMNLRQADLLTPNVEWATYFHAIGLPSPATQSYDVSQPEFLHELGTMMVSRTAVSWRDWRTYLRWQLVNGAAPYLSSPIEAEDFAFNQTTLQGSTTMRPRWERVEMVIDAEIGEALGRLYVERTFTPYAKEKARELVETVRAALRSRLQTVPWMGATTRAAAVAKCDAMLIKVGYPDKWRNYSALNITDRPYVSNVFAANGFEFQRDLNKIGKPTDRTEWDMTPPTINADYDDSTNSINIPAGILQPPFFDPSYDDAVNYGELGATVGHEMTHGFDNTGRLFDASGNLHNWWTPIDASSFKAHAAQIVAQYAAYEPLAGVYIDGDLSLTENIADIGGLKLAYLALEQDLQAKPQAPIDGFTPEQRYFISYAQGWRDLMRPALERELLATDPHSPPQYRVIGPCGDMPEFYEAFGVLVPNSAMKAGVW
jgi:putative endopeptidase